MNKHRLGADEGIYLLSSSPRLALQLFYPVAHDKTKQHTGLTGRGCSLNRVCLSCPRPSGAHRVPERAAELKVQHSAAAPHGCPAWMSCTVHCGALQILQYLQYFCSSSLISFQGQLCTASSRNLVCA